MNKTGKNIDIEFLRAAAILMILFQHGEVLVLRPDSVYWEVRRHLDFWGSVDLFFCVSGFIITRGLIEGYPVGSGDRSHLITRQLGWRRTAFSFWIRRAWRLWPSAWLWIVLAIGCAFLYNRSGIFGDPQRMLRDGLAAFLHLANFHWAGCYMNAASTCNFVPATDVHTHLPTGWALAIYWSLSLEEQFYFLVPLLLFFLTRRQVAAGLGLGLLALAMVVRDPLGLAWFVRVDSILVGIAIGWASTLPQVQALQRRVAWTRWRWLIRAVAGVLLLCISTLALPQHAARPGTVTLIALCSGGLVCIASLNHDLLIPASGLRQRFFLWVGARSYCIYLCHMVAYFLTIEIAYRLGLLDSSAWWWASALVAGTFMALFAEATARLVESPLRRHGHRRAARWLEAPSGVQRSSP